MAGGHRKFIWAPKARRDLIDIWKYFANAASPEIADNLLREINHAVERLREHPFSDRPRNEIAPGLRSILVHPHLIIYRPMETTVEIMRILHERQDYSAAFTENPN